MDVHTKDVRSYNMSRIQGKNTKPEEIVRKYLYSRGLRYRKNDKRYPGAPDIVIPKCKSAIFINGCFWHMHEGHPCFVLPKSNTEFWRSKLIKNQQRDFNNISKLREQGWRVFVIWECELKTKTRQLTLEQLFNMVTD